MSSTWSWITLVAAVVVVAGGVWSQVSNVEEPEFTLVEQDGAFELRDYPALIVAEATVAGTREVAINQGFRVIADYIFGNNISATKVAMTAPVIQQQSETIAMTAPVTQQDAGGSWTVRFTMPSDYTMATLPKPNNPAVTLKVVESQRMAVIRFSGVANDRSLADSGAKLRAMLIAHKLTALAPPLYAFYNPPWTLGFLRRNEVMIPVAK
ncbi:MAG: SOUL family heme-binding protein [Aestuariivirga sp.]